MIVDDVITAGFRFFMENPEFVRIVRYRKQADGLLIGVAAGAGFAALETMGYAFTTLIKSGGDIPDTVDILLLLRGFLMTAFMSVVVIVTGPPFLICSWKCGITEPREPSTLPKRTEMYVP